MRFLLLFLGLMAALLASACTAIATRQVNSAMGTDYTTREAREMLHEEQQPDPIFAECDRRIAAGQRGDIAEMEPELSFLVKERGADPRSEGFLTRWKIVCVDRLEQIGWAPEQGSSAERPQ